MTPQLDLSEVLDDRFVSPLANFLIASDSSLTSDDVAAFLVSDAIVGNFDGLEFSVGPTSGTEVGDELVFDTTLYATRSVDYTLDLGSAAPDGIRFDDPVSATSDADFQVTFDFQFGVDASGQFFAEIESLRTGVTDTVEVVAAYADAIGHSFDHRADHVQPAAERHRSAINATLPANTNGNLTPLTQRLTQA